MYEWLFLKAKAVRLIFALVAIAFATPTYSETLEQQENLNQMEKADEVINQFENKVLRERKSQCMAAVASEAFCECLRQKLPWPLNFVGYVTIVTQTKEELKYNILSADDKKVVDVARKARDQCLGQVAIPSPAAGQRK
jgi:hypothetical protein